jgi:gamma-glutamyltranspeptidase/glutathione hydrolase
LLDRGFVLDDGDIALFATATDDFRDDAATAAIFLIKGQPYKAGDRLVQKDLARTLRLIAQLGPAVF